MVSFTTITKGIFLVSITIFFGSSEAAPAAGTKGETSSAAAPHNNATMTASSYILPPIIPSRTKPGNPAFKGDVNAEAESIAKNKKWYEDHGGNFKNITKRDTETVGGMTMDLPANAPPVTTSTGSGVVTASAAQIANFKLYAGIASTAYCRGVVPLGSWTCNNCLKYVPDGKLLVTFSSLLADTNGFVLRSDSQKTIHLVFRGTNSIRSAITDLIFDLATYSPVSGAKVHRGFLASYKEVVNTYFPVVQAQLTAYPSYKVVISGHSLGGAQALLAGMDLYQRDKRLSPSNLSIYTVGCPRVGNPAFAYYVDSTGIPFSRSVNDRDIVPHVPPQAFGYLHPGVEAWDISSRVQICTANIETNKCSNSIVPFTSFVDHLTYYGINEGLCL
uniref:Lipase n=1 Tax=Mucor endophyticus TaxID=444774 RepID=A0A075C620_9FUNG|nr:lipase [Mucor endophyticus]